MSIRGCKSPGVQHCVIGNHQPNDIIVKTSDLADSKRLAVIPLLTSFWDPQDLCSSVPAPGVNSEEKCLCCGDTVSTQTHWMVQILGLN